MSCYPSILSKQPHVSQSHRGTLTIVTHTIAGGPEQSQSNNITEGFVQTHGLGICLGRYAKTLIKEWHRWDHLHESENDAVDAFPGDQLYVVFVFADGGADLERFELRSFEEAQSILLQVRARADSKLVCMHAWKAWAHLYVDLPDGIAFASLPTHSRLISMQGKLGHTSTLHCLTALLFLPFDDSRLLGMQAKFGHFYMELPDGVCCPLFFTSTHLCIQGKLGCTYTLSCLMAPSFSLLPHQACMHAFKCLSSLCRGKCSACGNGNPSVLGRIEKAS